MCEKYVEQPLYLLIATWMMKENRWISAKEIARHFSIDRCKAINTVSYIVAEVEEISCEIKIIPNQLEGRGCQCHRLVRVTHIDAQLYTRLSHNALGKAIDRRGPRAPTVPPADLNYEQRWQMMLSKSMRR